MTGVTADNPDLETDSVNERGPEWRRSRRRRLLSGGKTKERRKGRDGEGEGKERMS